VFLSGGNSLHKPSFVQHTETEGATLDSGSHAERRFDLTQV